MRKPKISVITVSYNQGEFIRDNIESVLAQQYSNFEHIIVDGGSSDDTVEILKSYSHLDWTSEPDRGQSHALNKGFAKANGEIIAWLNSDDWYPEEIFDDVAAALESYPIVLGACARTDRFGQISKVVPNVERCWYDILKYWAFFSIPDQPSIFFKRHVLEEVKLADGRYVDESLDYCMDYDLWLRIAQKYEFKHRIDRTLSYYRMYEDNKTGKRMDSAYKEMSRVYRRYVNTASTPENKFSFIIPIDDDISKLNISLGSLMNQSLSDSEVLVVDYSKEKDQARANREHIRKVESLFKDIGIRYLRSDRYSMLPAFNQAVQHSCAPFTILLQPGYHLERKFCLKLWDLFNRDVVGLILPLGQYPELYDQLSKEQEDGTRFNISTVFQPCELPYFFAARKLALLELGGLSSEDSPIICMRELILRMLFKGWHIEPDSALSYKSAASALEIDDDHVNLFNSYINAHIMVNLEAERRQDRFADIRAEHGYSLIIPNEMTEAARKLVERAPKNWSSLDYVDDVEELLKIAKAYPHFSPVWYLLAHAFDLHKHPQEAHIALQKFSNTKAVEMAF